MLQEGITLDKIMDTLEEYVREKHPISPAVWIDGAMKLNVLLSDEHDILYEMQQTVAKLKCDYLEKGYTVAASEVKIEATDTYKDMMRQKAKIGRVEELIRIAKLQSKLKYQEMENLNL